LPWLRSADSRFVWENWVAGETRADADNGGRVVLEGQHPGW
jgi:hypothetical protein